VLPDGTYIFNLGKFRKVLQWKMLVFFSAILSILRPDAIWYGHLVHLHSGHLVYFLRFGTLLYREKSGNPGAEYQLF
jgi:hypothetical protein